MFSLKIMFFVQHMNIETTNTNTLTLLDNNKQRCDVSLTDAIGGQQNTTFITKLKEHFTEEEQQLYVANLYMYMNYHPTNEYPINLEDVYKMIGFVHKKNAKRTLENNFIEGEDYKVALLHTEKRKNEKEVLLLPTEKQKTDENRGGHNKEDIMLNVDTFKNLCMLARTDQGKQIRKYYVKLENVYNEIINDEIQQSKQELEENKRQLEERNKQIEETTRELHLYKQKTYEEIEKTGHVYIIRTDGGYKVGKTKDINNRVKGLQTGNNREIEVVFDFKTSNSDLLEKNVHYILDRYRCNSNREFFDCDPEYIKRIITIVGSTIDTLKSCYKHISNDELTSRLESGVKFTINDKTDRPPEYNAENINFCNWLDKNVRERHNSLLNLKDVCESYLDKKNIHSSVANRIRIDLESWIRRRFDNIRYIYTDSSLNGIKYKGWIGLELVV